MHVRRFHCCVSNAESRQHRTQPLRFGSRVRILETRGTGKDRGLRGGREAVEAGWEAPIREDEGGTVARIAEVGHHVNCIPDCGLLKSSALHPNPP